MKKLTTLGLRHVALYVQNLEACEQFYREILGMNLDWRPDDDNIYLSSGYDNLALHRAHREIDRKKSPLDHIGFILPTPESVDEWHQFMCEKNVVIKAKPREHRDGTKSFYFEDPDGNLVQMIYYKLN